MSTVDVVAHVGGRPANFCDLGGGGNAEGVVDALEVITRDPQVKSIFFNIFGGITRCDEVARGILEALDRLDMSKYPIVVRLDGTNAEEGRKILADAGKPNIHPEATMLDGAERAVELATMSDDVWSERAEAYRTSAIHADGRRPRPASSSGASRAQGVTVLDVATGGGHVARRLREAGATVVTVDPAPGMQADTTAPAEDLPFADGSFDAVATPARRAPLRRRRAGGQGDGARRETPRRDLRQHVRQRVVRGGRPPARPEPRAQLRRRRVAELLRARRPRDRARSAHAAAARDRAVARRASTARPPTPRACASCSATASSTAG